MRVMLTAGPGARAEVVRYPGTESYALRLVLGSEVIVVGPSDGPGAPAELAGFLVSLAKESALLAAMLDPSSGRHMLSAGKEQEAQVGLAEWFGAGRPAPGWPE